MIYTVYKVLQEGSKQLLLVKQPESDAFSISVYDEHTGMTLMRLQEPITLQLLKDAIRIIES